MLIIFDDAIINIANMTKIRVDNHNLTYGFAGGTQIVQTCDPPAPNAHKIYNRIVDALKVG